MAYPYSSYTAQQEEGGGFGYFVQGLIVGGVLAILFAPRAGSELRQELSQTWREGGGSDGGLFSKVLDMIPRRVKLSAGVGAVKSGGKEALREIKNKMENE